MIRLLFYGILIYLVYQLGKSWFRSLSGRRPEDEASINQREADLIQDPHCGTYFLKQRGVPADVDGEVRYFCSKACRDAYLAKK